VRYDEDWQIDIHAHAAGLGRVECSNELLKAPGIPIPTRILHRDERAARAFFPWLIRSRARPSLTPLIASMAL